MPRMLRSVILLGLLHAVSAWSAAPLVTVSLSDTVTVEREQLTLGDVAQISGNELWRSRLQQLALGTAPRAGLSRRLEREVIEALIRERHGRALTIAWDGAEKVTVKRTAAEHAANKFIEPARDYLVRHLRERHADVVRIDAVPVGALKPLALPSGEMSLAVRQIRGDALAKRVCVWVDVSVDGVAVASLPIWFAVSVHRPAVVVTRNLTRHDRLSANDVRIEERDVAGLAAIPMAVDASFTTMRVRQPIAQGQMLLRTDVEAAPSVLRNQEIQVQVRSGGVIIETSGIAMQEGRVGDRVAVRNPGSQKDYVARVISEGVVMVSAQ
jgi:flagella basal body P-ring formation protein FlgA